MALQVEPRIGRKRHAVTLAEYDRMVAAGVFEPGARLELIRGEIQDMAPIGPEHETAVTRLHLLFFEECRRDAVVWPQGNSVGLPQSHSRPQPDIAILKWRNDLYAGKRPLPEDGLLLVEVSDSTLKFDRGAKLQLYAEAAIPEYWVVNLVDSVVEIYTDPDVGKYRSTRLAHRGEMVTLPGEVGGSIVVADILGRELQPDGEAEA